tara:strand:- start:28 stop:249 length:222 start_codon:yes stop_codon:yes gene_type:complete
MSKVKQWLWDEAEKAVDELVSKVKSGESVSKVLDYAKTLNIDWSFAGFTADYDNEQECWSEIEDFLYSNMPNK